MVGLFEDMNIINNYGSDEFLTNNARCEINLVGTLNSNENRIKTLMKTDIYIAIGNVIGMCTNWFLIHAFEDLKSA